MSEQFYDFPIGVYLCNNDFFAIFSFWLKNNDKINVEIPHNDTNLWLLIRIDCSVIFITLFTFENIEIRKNHEGSEPKW